MSFPSPASRGWKTAMHFQLEGGDVRCLQALRAFSDVEFNRLPLGERPVPVSLDRGEVHENVLTGLALDESKSLAGIEPLYCSLFFHLFVPSLLSELSGASRAALSRKQKRAASCFGLAAPFNKSKGFTRATNATEL
jgi:hypothetical protein